MVCGAKPVAAGSWFSEAILRRIVTVAAKGQGASVSGPGPGTLDIERCCVARFVSRWEQLISYEVAVTLTLVSVILVAGTLSMVGIVRAQEAAHVWYIFIQPIAFGLVVIGGLAETNRAPFDLPEAEQELTGGFHTEYSGMRFALFFLAEYANMIVVSSVATTLFLGGWLRPFPNVAALSFLDIIPAWVWFFLKTFGFLYIFLWVRATLLAVGDK